MDLNRELRANPPPERWFLRVQGITVGPLSRAEVANGIARREFTAADKICSSRDPQWRPLFEHPKFAPVDVTPAAPPRFAPLPPPSSLRSRRAPPPPAPALPAAEEVEKIVEAAPEIPAAPEGLEELAHAPEPEPAPEPVAAEPMPVAAQTEPEPEPEPEPLPEPVPPPPAAPVFTAPIPARPSFEPIFLAPPKSTPVASAPKPRGRTIQIELKLPERASLRVIAAALVLLALAAWAGHFAARFEDPNKTRDLRDSRLSDPSSPALQPSEAVDPNPPLQAPTRPQRE